MSSIVSCYLTWRTARQIVLSVLIVIGCFVAFNTPSALAGLNDDRYDGDIFALYAGNGSLVPPKQTLEQSLNRQRPALLVLYVDDSSDCKQYSTVISRVQEFYGRAVDLIPIRVDSLTPKTTYTPTEPGYYYKGVVPQTVMFDAAGKVVLNESGLMAYETIDDKFRQVFDLLPRTESIKLRRRQVNEFNTELSN